MNVRPHTAISWYDVFMLNTFCITKLTNNIACPKVVANLGRIYFLILAVANIGLVSLFVFGFFPPFWKPKHKFIVSKKRWFYVKAWIDCMLHKSINFCDVIAVSNNLLNFSSLFLIVYRRNPARSFFNFPSIKVIVVEWKVNWNPIHCYEQSFPLTGIIFLSMYTKLL